MSKGRPTCVSNAPKAASALRPVLPPFAIAPHQTPQEGTSRALIVHVGDVGDGLGDGLVVGGSVGDGVGLGSSGSGTEPTTGAPSAVGPSTDACRAGSRRVCGRRHEIRSCGLETTAAPALGPAGATARLTRPLRRTKPVTSAVAPVVYDASTRVEGAANVGAFPLVSVRPLQALEVTPLTCNAEGKPSEPGTSNWARSTNASAGMPATWNFRYVRAGPPRTSDATDAPSTAAT